MRPGSCVRPQIMSTRSSFRHTVCAETWWSIAALPKIPTLLSIACLLAYGRRTSVGKDVVGVQRRDCEDREDTEALAEIFWGATI